MKKNLFAFLVGSFSALAITNATNAQSSNSTGTFEHKKNIVTIDKLMSAADKTANIDVANTKALKDFQKSYKDASNEKWLKNPYGYTAEFVSNGINTLVYYDKKGNWAASLKTYGEEKFLRDIRGIVKSKYYDYKILQVQEIETINTNNIPTYLVYLEDGNDFMKVRVHDWNMDVYEQFKEQK
ncbi:MAG: hypothetical protein ACRDE8_18445 [Ginsengibacter sp.]